MPFGLIYSSQGHPLDWWRLDVVCDLLHELCTRIHTWMTPTRKHGIQGFHGARGHFYASITAQPTKDYQLFDKVHGILYSLLGDICDFGNSRKKRVVLVSASIAPCSRSQKASCLAPRDYKPVQDWGINLKLLQGPYKSKEVLLRGDLSLRFSIHARLTPKLQLSSNVHVPSKKRTVCATVYSSAVHAGNCGCLLSSHRITDAFPKAC
jgi:hypothetical protein